MVNLKNEFLNVTILKKGAEIRNVKSKKGTEFMWDANPKVWPMSAPVMFPVCGGLRDDKFIYENKEYTLQKHGYARFCDFEVVENSDTKAVFMLKSNEESKKSYPFDYEFTIKYELKEKSIVVTYGVLNKTDGKMYYSCGGHEAYACPEGIEEYSILFDKNVTLKSSVLNGNLLEHKTVTVLENNNKLDLKKEFFAIDALVFKEVDFDKVTLVNKNNTRKVTVEFDGFKTFMLWTKPEGDYICLEPWCNAPDDIDSDFDFVNKKGIMCLEKGEYKEKVHTITYED